MSRRILSIKLMSGLQPLIQLGILSPEAASTIVEAYKNGEDNELRNLVYSPDIPMEYEGILKGLKNYL